MEAAREAIREAAQGGIPLNVCFSLLYSAPVFLWCGDTDSARDALDKLLSHPNWSALPSLHATGLALRGELLIRLGDTERGIELLRGALGSMRAERQNILEARAACALAEGLAASGQFGEALSVISAAIATTADNDEALERPELLRIKATILLSGSELPSSEVEDCLAQSLACARRQCAKGWELRTTMTLARLRSTQGRGAEARHLLSAIYDQFTEGLDTHDLKAAGQLLRELDCNTSVGLPDREFDAPLASVYLQFNPAAVSGKVARSIE
jgi:predicted ATPase